MTEIIGPSDYSVHGPWLHVRRTGIPPHLLTYWGHGLRPLGLTDGEVVGLPHHWIQLEIEDLELKAIAVAPGRQGPWRALDHGFQRTRTVAPKAGKQIQAVIAVARSDRDHDEAMAL